MKRRNFLAAVGAVLAFPIAVAKGWLERKPKEATRQSWCDHCGAKDAQTYIDKTAWMTNPDRETLRSLTVDLCDACAKAQGYLCKNDKVLRSAGPLHLCSSWLSVLSC